MTEKHKVRKPGGHSRAAQNRKIRRDALREELKAREYIRQLHLIAERLDPSHKKAYITDEVPMAKARADIYNRLLDKCLPSLRPIDLSVSLVRGKGLAEQGEKVLSAVTRGQLTPNEAFTLMQVISAQARVVEVDELEKRVSELEIKHEA